MARYFLALVMAVVVGGVVYLLWERRATETSICADEVRGYQQKVESTLSGATKDIREASVKADGQTSKEYVDKLSNLRPSDFLALKTCDTQCRLLERCLNQNPKASVAIACPTEYADYQTRIREAMKIVSQVEEYAAAAKQAVTQAKEVEKTQQELKDAQNGVGASGGREQVLKQRVTEQKTQLLAHVQRADDLAKTVVRATAVQ
jgi:hypothetical protein